MCLGTNYVGFLRNDGKLCGKYTGYGLISSSFFCESSVAPNLPLAPSDNFEDEGRSENNDQDVKMKLEHTNGDSEHAKTNDSSDLKNQIENGEKDMDIDMKTEDESASNGHSYTKHQESEISKSDVKTEVKSPSAAEIQTDSNLSIDSSVTPAVAPEPAPPVLKGILSYNELSRKHTIRGNWNFESSTESKPQRFELIRNLGQNEDPKELPKNGEFHGSFSLTYTHISAKGKRKERSRVIKENGVYITFTKKEEEEDAFEVNGKGNNQYGIFTIIGTAVRDELETEKKYKVELKKRYITAPSTPSDGSGKKSKSKKRKLNSSSDGGGVDGSIKTSEDTPPPPPSESFPSGVVCLRGKVSRDASDQSGVVHKVSGLWAIGLDLILADPENKRGLCNKFEYEHRGTVPTEIFPISGRYTGWFNLSNEDGTRTRIPEKDVTLKFKKNSEGYYNVEGKGSNAFGKYNITGSMDNENVITIFRHFVARKTKKLPPPAAPLAQKAHEADAPPRLTLEDVIVSEQDSYDPIVAPADGLYAAVSRGVLRINEDGAHTCGGKWAVSRTQHNSNNASNFHFGLEEHDAAEGVEGMKNSGTKRADQHEGLFPVDSANYKGSFKMKRGSAKFQTVIDKQVVLKFRLNTSGSYNVYGKGINAIGAFDLVGTLISHGKGSGHVELFRIYPPEAQAAEPKTSSIARKGQALPLSKSAPGRKGGRASSSKSPSSSLTSIPAPMPTLTRRESSRQTKLPSRLEDGDPEAQLARIMEKCNAILSIVREKDQLNGSFFAEPVDPVAHGIPTYHTIITNPMDLGTIQAKMESKEITSPDEFSRLVRLVFQNAMTFNIDVTHVVHQSARSLLALFNQKFRDVERLVDKRKPTKAELKELKKKQQKDKDDKKKDKKRKHDEDDRLPRLQTSIQDLQKTTQSLMTVNSGSAVSRAEFSMMLTAVQQVSVQMQLVQSLFASVFKMNGQETKNGALEDTSSQGLYSAPVFAEPTMKKPPKRKKPPKKPTPEPMIVVTPVTVPAPAFEDEPLTLKEQEELTKAIPELSEDKLSAVIKIIQDAKPDLGDETEIDLDIDSLDNATQRKLQKFVDSVSFILSFNII